jgi:hypothetical protein
VQVPANVYYYCVTDDLKYYLVCKVFVCCRLHRMCTGSVHVFMGFVSKDVRVVNWSDVGRGRDVD